MIEICVDTREQKDMFLFKSYADVKVVHSKVDVGDYTVVGREKIVTIDRKRSSGELAINLGSDRARFNRELERMRDIEYCYFICTFPYSYLEEFPKKSGIPERRWKKLRINGAFLRKSIKEIEEKYPNIKFIFCNSQDDGENAAYQILREYSGGS